MTTKDTASTKADDVLKISSSSSTARTIGRAATLAAVVSAILAVASVIHGWNWSEVVMVFPYVAFEGGVAIFGLFQSRAKAVASWSKSPGGGEIFLPILGTWLYPAVVTLYGPTSGPAVVSLVIYFWLAWSILSLRTNFSVLPEARSLVQNGPYRIVRHPLYLGYCALWVAWAAEASSGVGPWLWAGFGILLFLYRGFVEERKMREFVSGYEEYCQKTPGLIPTPRPRRKSS